MLFKLLVRVINRSMGNSNHVMPIKSLVHAICFFRALHFMKCYISLDTITSKTVRSIEDGKWITSTSYKVNLYIWLFLKTLAFKYWIVALWNGTIVVFLKFILVQKLLTTWYVKLIVYQHLAISRGGCGWTNSLIPNYIIGTTL